MVVTVETAVDTIVYFFPQRVFNVTVAVDNRHRIASQ